MRPIIILLSAILLTRIPTASGEENWDAQKTLQQVEQGQAVLLDVREKAELIESGLARPAQSLPLSEFNKKTKIYAKFLKSLDKSKVVVTYCRSGRRAGELAAELEKLGYKTANMGGFDSWKKAGLPVMGYDEENVLKKKISRFSPHEIRPSTAHLTEGDRAALGKIIEAAKFMDGIYLRQVWSGNEALVNSLRLDSTPLGKLRLHYFKQNRCPWSRLDKNEAFLDNVPKLKPPGAGYYPTDMSKADFESWVKGMDAEEKARATGFFTVVHAEENKGSEKKKLRLVNFSEEYKESLESSAKLLKEAAALTTNESLKKFLKLRAEAFLSDDYYESDVAWMDLDSPIDLTIGPYETYEDELFGYKAAFEAFVTLKNEAESGKLAQFSGHLQDIENHLPIDEKYKNSKIGASAPIRVVDEVFASGEANRGVTTAAYNLPNDEKVVKEKGSKRVMLKNVQEAKFAKVLVPIASAVLRPKDLRFVQFEPFFTHILMHELMHGLGPHNIKVNGKESNPRLELKEAYSAIEEAKADITGLYAMQYLMNKGVIDKGMQESMYTTYLASSFRSVRFGITEAHGKGIAMQFNFLRDEGGIVPVGKGRFKVEMKKIAPAVEKLTRVLLTFEAEGAYEKSKEWLAKYGVVRPEMQLALDHLDNVPVDIEPQFPLAENELSKKSE